MTTASPARAGKPPARPAALSPIFAILINVVAVAAILSAALATYAHAQTDAEPVRMAALVRPGDMNSGALLLPSKEPGFYVQAPRLATDVKIDVTGPIARAVVTQRFENPSDGWVEGIYVFPLPELSAVDALKMRIGDRLIEGRIKRRVEARRIYEQAKQEGRKTALVEQQRPNLFTNSVANIGPGETIVVQIEYQQTVKQDAGTFSLRFPMVVAPRYSPRPVIQTVDLDGGTGWGVSDPVPDREEIQAPVLDPRQNAKINPVTLTVRLAAGFALGEVTSHYHQVTAQDEEGNVRVLTLANESVPADRDFELSWKADGTTPNAALFTQTVDGHDYVLAFITPPSIRPENLARKDREAIFVIDNSGSMAGESIVQAKASLALALKRLTPADRFNIVRFDDTFETLFPAAVAADKENIQTALAFARTLEAEGGTEMLPALHAALVDHHAGDGGRLRQVIFITDGAIGNESQLFDAIVDMRGRSRVFTIGIGSAPNSFFMRRAAEIGRGTFTHIGAVNEVAERMDALFRKLENPVMTGLRAELVGGTLSQVSPDPLPDLYAGEPVVLAARMRSATGTLHVSGRFDGRPWLVSMDLEKAAPGSGIGKLWARRKIASLEASRYLGGDFDAVDAEIETVALDHHLVSRLTSLVAVDVTRSRPADENLNSAKVPLNLPAGWDFDKVFGEPEAAPRRASLHKASTQVVTLMASAASPQEAARVASRQRQSIILPQTATGAHRHLALGGLLLLLAAMAWLTVRMWAKTAAAAKKQAIDQARRDQLRLPW